MLSFNKSYEAPLAKQENVYSKWCNIRTTQNFKTAQENVKQNRTQISSLVGLIFSHQSSFKNQNNPDRNSLGRTTLEFKLEHVDDPKLNSVKLKKEEEQDQPKEVSLLNLLS